jgi:hypothetical protein
VPSWLPGTIPDLYFVYIYIQYICVYIYIYLLFVDQTPLFAGHD